MVTAQATGHRVEDVAQRDQVTKVYANPDGTWTARTASEPERVQDESGVWHDIDTTLVPVGGGFAPAYAATDVLLSAGGDRTFATVTTEAGHELDWRWPTILPEPVLNGDTATYRDALPEGDLVVTALGTGFTHSVVLQQRPSEPVEIIMPMGTHGAELVDTPQRGVAVKTTAGTTLVSASEPLMWDSTLDAGGQPGNVATVDTEIGESRAGTPTLTLAPDAAFLADPSTVYPVTVDPSFTTYTNGDAWVQNVDYTSGQTSSQELRAGTYDGGGHVAHSYMHFDATKWDNKHVNSAKLVLRNFHSGSCANGTIAAMRVTEAWGGTTLTWANQPNGAGTSDGFTAAYGYNSTCGAADATWDVTAMVNGWATNQFANYGIKLKAIDETNSNTWRKYRSTNYDASTNVRPHLDVNYSAPFTPTSEASVVPGRAGYASSTTPSLTTIVSDPGGGFVQGRFEVRSGSTVLWTGTSSAVASGTAASVAVPSSVLSEGGTYSVRAQAIAGTDSSSFGPNRTFIVDTSAPMAPTIASATYPDDGLWHGSAGEPGSFSVQTSGSDTGEIKTWFDNEQEVARPVSSEGFATFTLTPLSNGHHTLWVTAVDRAGNESGISEHSFFVGNLYGGMTLFDHHAGGTLSPGATLTRDVTASLRAGDRTVALLLTFTNPSTPGQISIAPEDGTGGVKVVEFYSGQLQNQQVTLDLGPSNRISISNTGQVDANVTILGTGSFVNAGEVGKVAVMADNDYQVGDVVPKSVLVDGGISSSSVEASRAGKTFLDQAPEDVVVESTQTVGPAAEALQAFETETEIADSAEVESLQSTSGNPAYDVVGKWFDDKARPVWYRKGKFDAKAKTGWGRKKIYGWHNVTKHILKRITEKPTKTSISAPGGSSWTFERPVYLLYCHSAWIIFESCEVKEKIWLYALVEFKDWGGGVSKGPITAFCQGYYPRCPDWVNSAP